MEIINGYRLEKNLIKQEWLVFEKTGISGWFVTFKSKTKKEAKDWIKEQERGGKVRKKDRYLYESQMSNIVQALNVTCEHCNRKVPFFAYEKDDKKVCSWCGHYIFKNNKAKFKHEMKKTIIKKKKEGK